MIHVNHREFVSTLTASGFSAYTFCICSCEFEYVKLLNLRLTFSNTHTYYCGVIIMIDLESTVY